MNVVSHVRDLAIDRMRGALVILMVTGNFIAGISWVPDQLKHAPDIGFTIADTVAPAFVFLIGLNYAPSFQRRFSVNKAAAYRHFIIRYLVLIGIGEILSIGGSVANQATTWGVLEALGVAGLITLMVIRLSTWMRFAIGLALLAVYQYFLDTSMLQSVLGSSHGGPFGAISWGALLVLATAVGDIWRKRKKEFVIILGTFIALATFAALFVPVSKNRVSLSYILISLALSSLVFLAVELFSKRVSDKRGILCLWGEKALSLYLLHLILLASVVLPAVNWWYVDSPLWLPPLQLTVILTVMTIVARWLPPYHNKK